MRSKQIVLAALIGGMLASPGYTADVNRLFYDHDARSRPAAYLGTSISITTNSRREYAPAFRLGVGVRNQRITGAGAFEPRRNALIEFEPAQSEGSKFYIGGHRLMLAGDGRGPDAGTVLLAVAAAVGAVLLITQVTDSDDDDDDKRCMIEPELCN